MPFHEYIVYTMLNEIPDQKNVGLLLNLASLRTHLDIYELISANAEQIESIGAGKSFFYFVRNSSLQGIALNICKIYEEEKGYKLNTIHGVIQAAKMFHRKTGVNLKDKDITSFESMALDYKEFMKKNAIELNMFKHYRDKFIAHAEHQAEHESLPSFEIMEKFYLFAYQFYASFTHEFVGASPINVDLMPKPKVALVHVLTKFGVSDVVRKLPCAITI